MPSMILQPIVENAVKHGIADIDRPGEILLKVEQYEDHLRILVKDNGVGMTEEKMKEVLSGIGNTAEDESSTGIGLHNVISRLWLYYGQENLLTIHCDGTDKGTEVRIVIPRLASARRKGANHVSNTYSG